MRLFREVADRILWFLAAALGFAGCGHPGDPIVKEINIGLHHNNELKIQVDITTARPATAFVRYWPDSAVSSAVTTAAVSANGEDHAAILYNIVPGTKYSYTVTTVEQGVKNTGKIYHFTSHSLPVWLQEQFKYTCTDTSLLPAKFKNGWMLLNKRETPGVVYIIDYQGRLRWYHTVDGTGYKVSHFTNDQTIISILGKNDEPTSYGSEILEINLAGDTVTHIRKGQGDFHQVIHHEILKSKKGEIVTLFVDQQIRDLTSIGGGKTDTINGDGILVMDRHGKKIWQWSVFQVMDPLKDPKLLKTKKDWMHANSLNVDKDSNYLISFYNNGQIWKLDSHTGKVIFTLGKGGDIALPAECRFSQAHAVHMNAAGSLMFFDNGVEDKQSEVYSLKVDESARTASMDLHIRLPRQVYNERMGSAYMITDSTVLCCCSKRHITVLANRKGILLWALDTAVPPYRVEFLDNEKLSPYLFF